MMKFSILWYDSLQFFICKMNYYHDMDISEKEIANKESTKSEVINACVIFAKFTDNKGWDENERVLSWWSYLWVYAIETL